MSGFEDFGLSEPVRRALAEMGYDEPSPVQSVVVPLLLAGRDVIAQARTGTGKTAAFGIPFVEQVDPSRGAVQGLVLAPTRELAVQVAAELTRIGRFRGVSSIPIYGGQAYEHQFRAIRRGIQIVVATPGRLLDHIRRGTLDLSGVRRVALDEADEMLNLGFLEDVAAILEAIPTDRQLALFSATMPRPIADLARRYLQNPENVNLSPARELTAPAVRQSFYEVPRVYKVEALVRLLDATDPDRALVFCATKRMVDELAEELVGRGYRAEAIHGDISQAQRERVITAAREGRIEVLVATDVAARGIDIPEVTHVFNFDLPQDPEAYVHRIGRTGRAGRPGAAVTIVTPREVREIDFISRSTGAQITRAEVPTVAEVEALERTSLIDRVEACLDSEAWAAYRTLVERLAATHDPLNVAAAALSLLAGPAKERSEIPRTEIARGGGPRRRIDPRRPAFPPRPGRPEVRGDRWRPRGATPDRGRTNGPVRRPPPRDARRTDGSGA